jgi:FKBP-type peptidyl-prolyl cis-trans isomerase 2
MAYNFKAEMGDLVSVHYEGTLEDGTVFDSSRDRGNPLIFEIGAPGLIPEFSKAPIGMFVGQTKKIILTPENGYGPPKAEMVKEIEKDLFPDDEEIVIGAVIAFRSSSDNREIPGTIIEIKDDVIVVDFNHPMAGKTLNFEIELMKRGATVGQSDTDENQSG